MPREPSPFEVVELTPTAPRILDEIGRLRVRVWRDEGQLAEALFPNGVWLDEFDPVARHWVARGESGELLAAARLTVHERLDDSPDGYVWRDAGRAVPGPVANIAKLVVAAEARRQGVATELNQRRIDAAWAMGAGSITVTASAENARLLARLGFVDTGIRVTFDNRPAVAFRALELRRVG